MYAAGRKKMPVQAWPCWTEAQGPTKEGSRLSLQPHAQRTWRYQHMFAF